MSENSQSKQSSISITSKFNAPKKRTINECADILSRTGNLLNFKIGATDSVKFYVEVKPAEIHQLIDSLKKVKYLSNEIDVDIAGRMAEDKKPTLLNISLVFASN